MVGFITVRALDIIGLFRTDYLASFHVREMGRRLGTSHVTLLPHLRSLEKAGLLLSSEQGRNRAYALNFRDISAKYAITMAESAAALRLFGSVPLVKRIAEEVSAMRLAAGIALFGSYASGSFTEQSDIDLLAVGTLAAEEAKGIKRLGAIYGRRIDLKTSSLADFDEDLRRGDPLIREAVANHVLIHHPGIITDAFWEYYSEVRA